jgi:hypothetical protein
MSRPSAKQTVQLASSETRPSRIRRDPPPPVKERRVRHVDVNGRETRTVMIGVITFALALFVIILGFTDYFDP